jgi:hypothetical protein
MSARRKVGEIVTDASSRRNARCPLHVARSVILLGESVEFCLEKVSLPKGFFLSSLIMQFELMAEA